MKRYVCLFLSLILLFPLWGCREKNDTVTFYYRQSDFLYGEENGVIAPEERDASGHVGDLPFLLALYLVGPLDEALISPFPQDTKLLDIQTDDRTVYIDLSDTTADLSESEFSLACACMALTCLDMEEAESVTITSGSRSITMDHSNLLLYDNVTATTSEETK